MKKTILTATLAVMAIGVPMANAMDKYNFNIGWLMSVGDGVADDALLTTEYVVEPARRASAKFDDSKWKKVTLPHAFNEDEAFSISIHEHTDTVCWYRKHFNLDGYKDKETVLVEFEGVRMGADFYLNGHYLGYHENGVMAVGFDLTPYLKKGDNVLAVRTDNNWRYHERATGSGFQWNDSNFNANYGGLSKNVNLYLGGDVYQTLPLYSNLGTTGTYIYATDYDIPAKKATVHAESEVANDSNKPIDVSLRVTVSDMDGREVATFDSEAVTLEPGTKTILSAHKALSDLNFWSWGYGYLYDVRTDLVNAKGKVIDTNNTRTGFRKTKFGNGKVWLNDRVMQVHGYAQRTSNEWPAIGLSVPAWLSDYSNGMIVDGNGNLVRWMHVTPWKQDIESCDRVGLLQAMPAGDAEKDVEGRRWGQRTELMRDAIIYNRNNPSIIFYESGNESISRDHMLEMIAIRDQYDPHGGRAIGSREMLDIDEAEYGGEMLYINKSHKHPMWATEYCRDEGLRKYWDKYSYPFYDAEAEGVSVAYNHDQDDFVVELVRRWYDYWRERPGTGTRVSSGGVKIIFSDSNTHFRGVENYRRSGVTDPMRIPKDAYYAQQVMWNGWVDVDTPQTHIVGHWNYPAGTVKPVYVVSSTPQVELLVNGKSLGMCQRDYNFLFTMPDVTWAAGNVTAIGRDENGNELTRTQLTTAGSPASLKLEAITNPSGFKADCADLALIQFEVVDANGQRCPLDDRMVHFTVSGPAEWRGGIGTNPNDPKVTGTGTGSIHSDDYKEAVKKMRQWVKENHYMSNYVLSDSLPVECGINRALVRSTGQPGQIVVTATAAGLDPVSITLNTEPVKVKGGLSTYLPGKQLDSKTDKGPTPLTPSYRDSRVGLKIVNATAGYDADKAILSYDDNELSEWRNDGHLNTGWITYTLDEPSTIDDICIKLTGWRQRSYPIEIYAGSQLIWSGNTEQSLGYIHIPIDYPIPSDTYTIRLKGQAANNDAFGEIVEVVAPTAGELDLFKSKDGDKAKNELRIVEIEFLKEL